MSLILFGFKSCGKTFLGKELARRLSLPFVDTDERLFARFGKNAPGLFREMGQVAFRDCESQIVQELTPKPRSIIALGGGSLDSLQNILHVQQLGALVYLEVRFETVLQRLKEPPAFIDNQNGKKPYAVCTGNEERGSNRFPLFAFVWTYWTTKPFFQN